VEFTIELEGEVAILSLEGKLGRDESDVEDIRKLVSAALDTPGMCVVDCTKVTGLDLKTYDRLMLFVENRVKLVGLDQRTSKPFALLSKVKPSPVYLLIKESKPNLISFLRVTRSRSTPIRPCCTFMTAF